MIKDNNQVNTKENLPNNDDKDYSIYNFLCQNVNYCIAIVTILITVFSYFVNHMSYALGIAELKYWGIDPSAIAIYTQPLTYSVVNTIICFFLFSISINLLSDAYITCIPDEKVAQQLKLIFNYHISRLKAHKSELNSVKKSLKECQVRLPKLRSKAEATLKNCNNAIKYVKKVKRAIIKRYFSRLIWNVLAAFALLDIALKILYYTNPEITTIGIIPLPLLAEVIVVLYCLIKYIKLRLTIKQKVSKDKDFNPEDFSKIELPTNEYLREKIASQGIKILLKNSFFHSMGKLVLLLLLFNLTAIYPLMNLMLITKKQFHLLQLEGKTYVSLYTNTRQTVLADAIIKNNNLSIVKNKHRIIATEGSQYKIVTFDKVQHIDTPDKQNVE